MHDFDWDFVFDVLFQLGLGPEHCQAGQCAASALVPGSESQASSEGDTEPLAAQVPGPRSLALRPHPLRGQHPGLQCPDPDPGLLHVLGLHTEDAAQLTGQDCPASRGRQPLVILGDLDLLCRGHHQPPEEHSLR